MMKKEREKIRYLTQAGLVAAIYTALCLVFQPISFGFSGVEMRISEALSLLPVVMPAAVPGLFVGCLLANILGGATILDIVFGSLTTLAAAILTRKLRRKFCFAALPPVVLNAVVVGTLLRYAYGLQLPLLICMGSIALGQAAACYGLGAVVLRAMEKLPERYWK